MRSPPGGEIARHRGLLFAAFVGIATGVGAMPFYAIGPFMLDLQAEFGWSRTEISSVLTWLALALLVASPLAGRLADARGVRPVALVSTLLFSASLAALYWLPSSLWVFAGVYIALGLLGAGTGPVTYTRALADVFDRRRGLAFGLALTGTGVAGIVTPLLIQSVSEAHGWRAAWLALGALPLLAWPILAWGLPRRLADRPPISREGASLKATFRDRRFWTLGAALFLISLFVAGFVVHMVPLLMDGGLDAGMAARITALIGLAVIVSRILVGAAVDRFPAARVATVVFTTTALGCLTLAVGGTDWAWLAALAFGAALGAEVDLIGYLVSRYFGLRHYGQIYGWQYGFYVSGAALSPVLVARLQGMSGSYDLPLLIGAFAIFLAGLLFLTLGPTPGSTAKGH